MSVPINNELFLELINFIWNSDYLRREKNLFLLCTFTLSRIYGSFYFFLLRENTIVLSFYFGKLVCLNSSFAENDSSALRTQYDNRGPTPPPGSHRDVFKWNKSGNSSDPARGRRAGIIQSSARCVHRRRTDVKAPVECVLGTVIRDIGCPQKVFPLSIPGVVILHFS